MAFIQSLGLTAQPGSPQGPSMVPAGEGSNERADGDIDVYAGLER